MKNEISNENKHSLKEDEKAKIIPMQDMQDKLSKENNAKDSQEKQAVIPMEKEDHKTTCKDKALLSCENDNMVEQDAMVHKQNMVHHDPINGNQKKSKVVIEEKQKKTIDSSMTLEEKRKKEIANKMTIEEKRKLQGKKQATHEQAEQESSFFTAYFKQLKRTDSVFLILLVLCELMNIYISLQIVCYLKMLYAGAFFVAATLLIAGVFLLMVKKRKVGFLCNAILSLVLMLGSVGAYRMAQFSGKVFNNVESETVMIVVKKDSKIDVATDFTDKKLAVVSSDSDINEFVKEMLTEENKNGYDQIEYRSYYEAYHRLMDGTVDFMVYTTHTRQYLEERDIDSWSNVKVLFQRNRKREAVASKAVDISEEPFNVLISGVDLTSENINEKGSSDVNILLSVNPKTKKAILQTIPRDSWVALPCLDNRHTKLTYAGAWGGIDCSIKAIEEYLDIEINYYAKINFQGTMDLVDALGGISIYNDIAFCTPYMRRDGTSAEVCFQEGKNDIDGAQALIYSRIRKIFSDGDIERGRHQMEVIGGIINKFSQEPSIEHINSLLLSVENNFTTNFREDDAMKALNLFLSMSNQFSDIPMYTMEGKMLWNTDEVTKEYLYYFYPDEGQIDLVRQRIDDLMNDK